MLDMLACRMLVTGLFTIPHAAQVYVSICLRTYDIMMNYALSLHKIVFAT
jgi:hypothetical protein